MFRSLLVCVLWFGAVSSQHASVPSRVSDGALVNPPRWEMRWAVSGQVRRSFSISPMLSVSLAQTQLESTGVVDAGWCFAAGLAATLDAQKDKLEVVPELLFSGRCPSYANFQFFFLVTGNWVLFVEAALGAAAAFFPKRMGWGCVCSSCSCVPGFFPDSSS